MPDADRLNEIRARVQAATKGTWGTVYDGAVYYLAADMRLTAEGTVCSREIGEIPDADDTAQAFHDAMFIGRAPDDIRFLLNMITQLLAENQELAAENETLTRALGLNEAA